MAIFLCYSDFNVVSQGQINQLSVLACVFQNSPVSIKLVVEDAGTLPPIVVRTNSMHKSYRCHKLCMLVTASDWRWLINTMCSADPQFSLTE